MKYLLMKSIFIIALPIILAFPKRITLGGLFLDGDPSQQAFILSINAVNKMRHSSEEFSNVFLVPEILTVTQDPYEVSQNVCSLVGTGVAAIFGPQDEISSGHVQSMCDTMDVPNIVTRWDTNLVRLKAINFYPHSETLSMIFLHLVTEFKWKSFTVLYENTAGLIHLNRLLEKWDPKGYPVTLRHLGAGPDYRSVLKRVRNSGEENIVIDCTFEILEQVLVQSQQVGILSDRHKVIITSLDLQTLDLEPYQYSGVNITGLRLVDPEDPESIFIFNEYLYDMGLDDLSKMRVEWALTFDAVQVFGRAFKQFKDAVKGNIRALSCDGYDSWEHGASLANFMRSVEMKGLTGLIKFHTNGFRSDFQLNIVRLEETGLRTIGTWNSTNSIEWLPEPPAKVAEGEEDLANKTFIVLISLLDPYNMLTESSTMKTGNDRYEGFAIDIIHELSKILHFNYTFVEQIDKDYGNPDPKTGKWSGMIGRIMNKEADLAITDLTITSDREKAVDFTMPFLTLGISILYKKPTKAPPSLFSFLAPMSVEVWLALIGAYVFVSLLFFICGRICPAEWNNPYPCVTEPEELENQFTLTNSLWFTIGSIMQQGSEIAPIGTSTRVMAGVWWFFCLIMANAYTANLASSLTVETNFRPIKSAEDLANLNGEIKYGAKRGGSTYLFFKGSNYSTYAKMYKYMEDNAKDVLTDDNDKGKERVLKEDYAFLMESSSIEYIQERECDLAQIGGLLDSKGYGIAMRKHFPYRNKLNTAVLQMQESGQISDLRKKWWREKRGGGKCEASGKGSAAEKLTLDNVGGVFLVLVAGVAVSILYTAWEMIWGVGCTAYKERVPFKRELMEELKFIARCRGTVKPVRLRRGSSRSARESTNGDDTPPYGGFVPTVITTTHEKDQP
ncbi:hypothetical protein PV326_001041 [Microctonus aethiopoides]|uniref:Uncharacterized protein n=1 Tax=Microctonus aethiopoides TaxID=144406 RepID=A0AA39FIR4_9HYME|nr:hypothetical protein PV326_001041 [Microctonus aethiopoides]KAK0170210.1 hypothetical protein PV328_010798 [Microctonus aethiopoides]